jgi:hypothetical protein
MYIDTIIIISKHFHSLGRHTIYFKKIRNEEWAISLVFNKEEIGVYETTTGISVLFNGEFYNEQYIV